MDYIIKEIPYTRSEFNSLFSGRIISTNIVKDTYTLNGQTKKGYVSPCETFRLIISTDSPLLYALSKLDDAVAREFIDKLAKEVEATVSSIAMKEAEDNRREIRKKALEIIEQLK